ncbi:tail fiber assembly protein [Serratia marcescens]|uniref:Tail fiber assembly protein n=1 Tax=Serratia marcescens TaxID=615 RepID=A0ABD6I282_SERMA|nr:tail fiber assembly protein [Serratia marcescens]MVF06599.1 tail fiber assembly protein [Serratia marcescens]
MGKYKFSATTTGFYPVGLLEHYENAGTLPADLVDVADDVYIEFTGPIPEGKVRGSNKKGHPVWVPAPQPTLEQLRRQAAYQKQQGLAEAEAIIVPLARAVKLNMATDEEKVKLEAWERYSVLLSRFNPDDTPTRKPPEKPIFPLP